MRQSYSVRLFVATSLALLTALCASAQQEGVWVQLEALPSRSLAQERARAYDGALDNVAGFRSGSRWFVVALGPYTEADAARELAALRAERLVPPDAYLTDGAAYRDRFWPLGPRAGSLGPVAPNAPAEDPAAASPGVSQEPAAPDSADSAGAPRAYIPDETRSEALRSERALTGAERRRLQEALAWFGHYTAGIDGAFGPGTRRAMESWQAAQGYPPTGVLTTAQRAEVIAAWRAPFDALGLATIRDEAAGIALTIPAGRLAHARTEPPFVQYEDRDGAGMRLLLISQPGDAATLAALYDTLQTLEIVPPEGPRSLRARDFTIRARSARLRSHSHARLVDGAVKGFVLVWTDAPPRVMDAVVAEMEDSLVALPGVLDGDAADTGAPRVDLLAGLEVRRPARIGTGFFVDRSGAVLTAADTVEGCARVTLGDGTATRIAAQDDAAGLALLRPEAALAPRAVARFAAGPPRLRAEVAVAGFSFGDAIDLPLLTYGRVVARSGLDGETGVARLDLAARAGDVGGPVFERGGTVLGVLAGAPELDGRRLPEAVTYAVDVATAASFLGAAGISPPAADVPPALAPEALAALAADLAVRVDCWD